MEATLPALIADLAARRGDRTAVIDGERRIAFAGLDALRREAGRAFLALGIARGERVAIWAHDRLEWIVAALGLQSIGAVMVPLSTRLKGPEAARILARAQARVLICDPGHADYDFPEAILAAAETPPERIVVFDDRSAERRETGWAALLVRADEVAPEAIEARAGAVRGEDLADIIFTSGTTGAPKGVPLTHAQSLAACRAYSEVIGLTAEDVLGVAYPFAHNAGYRGGWLTALSVGACAAVMPRLDARSLVDQMRRDAISVLPAVPTIHQEVLDLLAREGGTLPSLRLTTTGATTIPVPLICRMREGYGVPVLAGYGLTEAAGAVTMCRPGDDDETVALTVGRPLPGLEVSIRDADGRPVAPGEVGEICVRGFTVTEGYFQDPAASAAAFTADGSLRTGDAGRFDAAGNLKITDRLKDMYIAGGFNCYPAEIEQALLTMPGVAAAAVVGVDDTRLGQVGRAFLVAAPGSDLTESQVVAWARERMAGYKVPRSVVFLGALPLNAVGKVAKEELRRRP